MAFHIPSFSKSFTTCGAAACAALALCLQNSDTCVNWLREQLDATAFYSSGRHVSQLLQSISKVVYLERLDHEEKDLANKISEAMDVMLSGEARDLYTELSDMPEAGIVEGTQDEIASIPERTSATPHAAEESQKKTPTQHAAKAVSPGESETALAGRLVSPLQRSSKGVQSVVQIPKLPPRDRHGCVLEDEEGPSCLAINEPPQSLSMADALEYALGSGGKRRAPSPVNRSPLPRPPQIPSPDETQPSRDSARRQPPQHLSHETGQAPRSHSDARTPDDGRTVDAVPGPSAERVQPESTVAKLQMPPAAPESVAPGKIPPMRYRIQMVGDSMMADLGHMVHSAMRERKGVEFILSAKPSTGLSRPDYFNWPVQLRGIVDRYKPDLVVFFFGANDSLPVLTEEGSVPIGGQKWRDAYAKKMAEMVEVVHAAGGDVIWIQMPALGTQRYKHMREIQIAQREFCEKSGVASLCADDVFSGEWGRFEPFGNFHGKYVRLRTKDTAHVTREGNLKLIEYLMPIMEERMTLFYEAHPERRLSAEEVARIHKVPAVVVTSSASPKVRKKERKKEKTATQPL